MSLARRLLTCLVANVRGPLRGSSIKQILKYMIIIRQCPFLPDMCASLAAGNSMGRNVSGAYTEGNRRRAGID
ncbi:hypothetical protein EZJ58_1402 [Sodalis ligni]|uniref:Uncharacterized protein n=1 Tax=Sodalis ligni TaxID=2697027 RepID=A0A4R1NGS5_9GAMM|nr:hypothetical protein EZJ58_1402 [Sodalis ligni]